jgi:signal transduction protein with GAF and PtsI domain
MAPLMTEPGGSHLDLLHRISSIVSSAQDLEAILNELVSLAMNVTNSDACLVYLIDRATNEVVLRASQLPHDAEIGHVRLKVGEGITGWVAAHRSVVAIARNAPADARFKSFSSLPEDAYEAFLSAPLVSGGELIGVMNVQHREAHAHSSDEVALLTFIGEQMGGLIGRQKLEDRSLSAAKRMETLAVVAQTISSESYPERILQAICDMVAEALNSAACAILLVDEEKGELTVSAARCLPPDSVHRMPVRMEGSLAEAVIRGRRPVAIRDIGLEKQYGYPELAWRSGLVSALAAPLLSMGKAIGAIAIYTQESRVFSDDEAGFLTVVAGQAAIAIQNARLASETLEMKRTLEARKVIERAKGILQFRHGLTEEEAYLRLRNESRRLRRSMRELAEAVILAEDLSRRDAAGTVVQASSEGPRRAEV